MLTESLVKYLAGLLDADGSMSFTFRRQRDKHTDDLFYMSLKMNLTSSDAVDLQGFVASLPELTGMGSVNRYGAKKQFLAWEVYKRADIEMLLPRVIKHMVIKARHWQWQLDLLREKRGVLLTPAECEDIKAQSKVSRATRSGPLKPKNHPTWAWLSGYLDGDGSYHMRCYKTRQGYEQWNIAMSAVAHANDRHVLDFLAKTLGGIVRAHGQTPNVFVWWRSLGADNRSYALRALPYLAKHSRLKRHKIDAMISHHRRQQRLSDLAPAGEAIV